jgi:3-oxoacyl-[acyl-carrier protein] reductase
MSKTALITGGGRGIGAAVSRRLSGLGYNLAINYRTDASSAESLAAALHGQNRQAKAYRADVSDAGAVNMLIAEIEKDFGGIDVLINNAGIALPKNHWEISYEDWTYTIRINLDSAFLMIQAVVPGMIDKLYGRIINISSIAAFSGGIVGPHYTASKAGMIGLTHYYARALIGHGITVNAVAPALIDTDMLRKNLVTDASMIPMGRFGTPDEVAEAVDFFISNGFVTGQTIQVNGGMLFT